MRQARSGFKATAAFVLLCVLALGCVEASSQQQRRRRPSRRVTHPVRPQPVPTPDTSDPTLVSSADDASSSNDGQTAASRSGRGKSAPEDAELQRARKNLERMSDRYSKLSARMDELEKQRNIDLIQERLTRAEQRQENLQEQLLNAKEKEVALEAHVQDIDFQLQPDNLQSRVALVGTFHPDQVREQLQHQLESEKTRTRAQLDLIVQNRTRLEASLATADTEVTRLRERLNEASGDNALPVRSSTSDTSGASGTKQTEPTASPTPTPTPPDRR